MKPKSIGTIPVLAVLALFLTGSHPAGKVQNHIEASLSHPEFRAASVAVLAITAGGDTLAAISPERMMLPASNLKLVTTGLALFSLGPEFRWDTGIGYDGEIRDSVLYGNLYIIGGGDPTTGSDCPAARPLPGLFADWTSMIRQAGIRRIEGHVIGDGRCFTDMPEQESWQYNDIGTYYGAGATGLSFFENRQNFSVRPGDHPGAPLDIRPEYPQSPWMRFRYECTTGKAGTGNSLYLYTSGLSPEGVIRGTFAEDRKPKTEEAANKFPEYTCAWYFWRYLQEEGIVCTGGPADTGPVFGPEGHLPAGQDSLKLLGATQSPTLLQIAGETNRESNNFFAETIMKTLGMEYSGEGCYDSSYVAIYSLLEETGTGSEGLHLADGSGLSRQNYASPGFMCRFLKDMAGQPCFRDFLETLPYPGGPGTLQWIMQSCPQELKGRIRMKSGSMSGVRCYSGYIIPESGDMDGTVIFSIMVNNYTGRPWRLQSFLEDTIICLFRK